MGILASLGIFGVLLTIAIWIALACTYVTGVLFGCHHSIILGLVSLLPPVGVIEGILHLAGAI